MKYGDNCFGNDNDIGNDDENSNVRLIQDGRALEV
jgi:chromosome condensin MukBEF MukE localization factor